jgi:hypothetical protein
MVPYHVWIKPRREIRVHTVSRRSMINDKRAILNSCSLPLTSILKAAAVSFSLISYSEDWLRTGSEDHGYWDMV